MTDEQYVTACRVMREIQTLETRLKEAEEKFNCSLVGTYQDRLEPNLVEACQSIFVAEFKSRIKVLRAEFAAI